jgi:hypothetical protein
MELPNTLWGWYDAGPLFLPTQMDGGDAMMPLDPTVLARLLREAANAHHTYEATLGHKDEDWAVWYAEYIIAHIQEDWT